MNLFHELTSAYKPAPDKVVLRQPGGDDWTCTKLTSTARQMADTLHALGLRAPDRVLVNVEKSAGAVALYLACLHQGLVFVPLNTAYTASEIEYFLTDLEPSLYIADDSKTALIEDFCPCPFLTLNADGSGSLPDAQTRLHSAAPLVDRAADDIAVIVYTSGTTGRSKGAMLSNRNLLSNAQALTRAWRWQPGDVLLHALPIYHVHGLFIALHCAMLGGSTINFLTRFDPVVVCQWLPQSTVMMGVPTFYTRLLDTPQFTRAVCQSMRVFISGSAPMLAVTHEKFFHHTGHRILERYGMSETNIITSNPFHGERVPESVGYPLDQVQVRVCEAGDQMRPAGDIGQIQVRGPGVFEGYWRRPELQKTEFTVDGYFRTGDLGSIDKTGRLFISGRGKDLIISGGLNVYPKEVESHIDQLDGVVESAVVGFDDADFGERVVAFIVARSPAKDFPAEVQRQLSARLARFKVPKQVYLIDSLPRNAMGKVQKNVLRKLNVDTLHNA